MPDTETDPRREIALFRYRVIAEALSLPAGSPERRAARRAQARLSHAIPGSRRTRVAVETMRDWITRYEQDGFEALYPKPRSDRGRSRRMPPEIADLLVSLKERSPHIAVREVIRQARNSGRVPAGVTLAPSTVNRLLHSEGLMDPAKEQAPAKDRRRFAYRSAGELWMSDILHGPKAGCDSADRRKRAKPTSSASWMTPRASSPTPPSPSPRTPPPSCPSSSRPCSSAASRLASMSTTAAITAPSTWP